MAQPTLSPDARAQLDQTFASLAQMRRPRAQLTEREQKLFDQGIVLFTRFCQSPRSICQLVAERQKPVTIAYGPCHAPVFVVLPTTMVTLPDDAKIAVRPSQYQLADYLGASMPPAEAMEYARTVNNFRRGSHNHLAMGPARIEFLESDAGELLGPNCFLKTGFGNPEPVIIARADCVLCQPRQSTTLMLPAPAANATPA